MKRRLLQRAVAELLESDARDHELVTAVLHGAPAAPAPRDPDLAALAAELHRLRRLEDDATTMALLAGASQHHAPAVERHLSWLATRTSTARVISLVEGNPVAAPAGALAAAC